MLSTSRPLRLLFSVTALLASSVAAHAESPAFEITPFVGARMGGGFDLTNPEGNDSSVDLDS